MVIRSRENNFLVSRLHFRDVDSHEVKRETIGTKCLARICCKWFPFYNSYRDSWRSLIHASPINLLPARKLRRFRWKDHGFFPRLLYLYDCRSIIRSIPFDIFGLAIRSSIERIFLVQRVSSFASTKKFNRLLLRENFIPCWKTCTERR